MPAAQVIIEHVRGVEKVVWQTSKTSQNNPGSHLSERSMLVYSSIRGPGSASRPIEIELTRHQHMRGPRGQFTVTVIFKEPPEGLLGEAWRILLAATEGKQLLPAHVQQHWKKHVAQWEGREAASDSNPGAPATDDAMPAEAEAASASSLAAPAVSAPGLPLEPYPGCGAAITSSFFSKPPDTEPDSAGDAGPLPNSNSQVAEAEATNASPLAAHAVLAPGLPPEPYAGCGAAIMSSFISKSPETEPDSGGDAGAWPNSAGQLADAEAMSTSFLLSASPGAEPDWTPNDVIDVAAFDGTPALSEDLEKEVGPMTADALLGDMEQQEVRNILLPDFLRPGRKRPQINDEMAKMQRLKEAEPEHICWGSPTVLVADPTAVAVTGAMRAFVRQWAQGNYVPDLGLLRGMDAPGEFLVHALNRSLGVLELRDSPVMQI